MADKKIFEDNIKRLIQSAGREQKMPEDKKGQILNHLISSNIKIKPAEKTISLWKLMLDNPVTKLAVAAVIFLVAAILFVHQGPDEQRTVNIEKKIVKSPAEMTTFLSMSLAYKKGGLEGLEEHCDETARFLAGKQTKITLNEMLKELNNHKNERL
jgi:hypothetical protein